MENFIPETCCCFLGLETGATVIGVLTLAVGVLFGVLRLGLVQSLKPADGTEFSIEVVLVIFAVIAGLSLILAVKTQKRFLCWPYFILQILFIILMIYQLIIAVSVLQDRPIVKSTLAKITENLGDIGGGEPAAPVDPSAPGPAPAPRPAPAPIPAPAPTTNKPAITTTKNGQTTPITDPVLRSIEDDIIADLEFLRADPPAGFNVSNSGNSTSTGHHEQLSDTRLVFEIARDAALTGVCFYFLLVVFSFYRKLGYVVAEQKPDA